MLTRADLKPLADDAHGTFVEDDWTYDGEWRVDIRKRLRPTAAYQRCEVRRTAEDSLVRIDVQTMDESEMKQHVYGTGSGAHDHRLDFGADVQGWVGQNEVGLGLRCDNPENAAQPYVGVQVNRGTYAQPSDRSHRAVLDIALKVARAVVADYPCSNPVGLPDSIPGTAPGS
ncbi:hypothetical protein [Kitasatospora sp. NPDC096140]|uniref:hypothetical protein n=1 Tax=Kitasatospora sp. NPDC096140 TaxID=3155425 RepID=UPI003326A3B4